MESTARLDYVLFHLTPTRTRCDLVIFAGKLNEKLAYGLLAPFIAHLRSAKEQISKGGYSVTLRPPSSVNAHWFTKGTVLRFVRFVSTPEVLERFVTIEREISQLENSIQSYEASNADGETEGNSKNSAVYKSYGEFNESSDLAQEETSKVRLHRVVETRKAVLRKEQAMVYARALAAGYEMNNLHDLLLFSDAFGASRLREACINFKELCKKKNEDRHWVDEIAAMQAIMQPELSFAGTSGIILAGEDNDPSAGGKNNSSTDASLSDSITSHGSSDANQDNGLLTSAETLPNDSRAQMQNPWANQFPPYLRNFQGPMYPQMPPYQGYAYPGMQVPPPYYPANMPWPSDVNGSADRESYDRRDRKSGSRKKGKASNARGSGNEGHDGNTEPSGSSTETETDSSSERSHRKKHGKKSSRKVVIRNINYISSKRDGEKNGDSETDSSDEDDYLDGDSLKQQLENAVGSFEKHQKSTSRHHKKRNGSKLHSSITGSADQDNEDGSLKTKSGTKANENWDALQQLLMKEDSDSNAPEPHSLPVEEEYFPTKRSEEQNSCEFNPHAEERTNRKPVLTDAFIVTEKGIGNDDNQGNIPFESSESFHPIMRRGDTSEEFLFSQRTEEPDSRTRVPFSDDTPHPVIKGKTSDDWFVSKQSNEAGTQGENSHLRFIDGDYVTSSANQAAQKKDSIVDDSLMIQGRLTYDNPESQLRTDISLVSDFVEASITEKGTTEVPQKSESLGFYEPDDFYMVLDRGTGVEQIVPSWTPELDYESNVSFADPAKKSDADACTDSTSNEKGPNNKKSGATVTKSSSKDARLRTAGGPIRRGKPETTAGNRRSTFGSKTTTPKSQFEKDEERRKRMEQLAAQRQKRIAEKSGASPMSSKKPLTGRKSVTGSLSSDKSKLQSSADETKKPKPILRSSTIERLAAAKTIPKAPVQPNKVSKVKGANVNSGSQKGQAVDSKKLDKKISPSENKVGNETANGVSSSISEVMEAKSSENIDAIVPPRELPSMQISHPSDEADDSRDIKELHITSSVVHKDVIEVVQMGSSDEKVRNPLEDHSKSLEFIKENSDEMSKRSISFPEEGKVSDDHGETGPVLSIHPVPESPTKVLGSGLVVDDKVSTNGYIPGSPEISVVEESTPPYANEMNLEPTQLRKKWDGPENSPKSTKGFRKLLMFGRKS